MTHESTEKNPMSYWINEADVRELDALTSAIYQPDEIRRALELDNINGYRTDKLKCQI